MAGSEGGWVGVDEGKGCLKEIKLLPPHYKPQVFYFNLKGQPLLAICST